ncbi:hypothetical protein EN836_28565 [Mesorhizobium sp. M1C.F.Ca.ET.193.01.1.1]|uniref:hypothetical protein n=1 Tax=unclassified Mesorhizobium TaxID=325217 RepID=UPI000FD2677D|nr:MULTISPECIES: hypothetical protein [unclassified Mesorhizobium]TGS93039.1 hypothetical protein EN820_49225 [bacterium M00.F.Ca.ET.177.01.1.1]TGQ50562.1 hypothetical protein EN853_28555 [Mesorhizobium sp. M1C.F.Ca.ET.210.01.1.1]TGQ65737.1 hypothetical protein EN855_028570 [Mesorhizobium sp. M1C.F.Ca.ET.212.01.1.1]TGQ99467.1 hypothetical protein EN847_28555 [Mesorhizobium sp. M1C.F.Ca.ET.204.01.1.1]TGR19872.1 hypothetical protein EN839_28555 [Mesorhizobium sp. M1C.F.Ca.ET.196.01.1.1]
MSELTFRRLSLDWNAESSAPDVELNIEGNSARLSFLLNPAAHDAKPGEIGTLHFVGCSRYRWDASDDHAWFAGKDLCGKQAPKWGEFYEVSGDSRAVSEDDWDVLAPDGPGSRLFLLCFRDDTIEVVASDWSSTRKMPSDV